MDKYTDKRYNQSYWLLYCEAKDQKLRQSKERGGFGFMDAIKEIENACFEIIESPSKARFFQKSFLVELNGYPYIIPFQFRGYHIQLITMFPSRRFKNAFFK